MISEDEVRETFNNEAEWYGFKCLCGNNKFYKISEANTILCTNCKLSYNIRNGEKELINSDTEKEILLQKLKAYEVAFKQYFELEEKLKYEYISMKSDYEYFKEKTDKIKALALGPWEYIAYHQDDMER